MSDKDADRLLADALRALDLLTDRGDHTARHAAAILRGIRSAGPPEIDDTKLLAEVREAEREHGHRRAVAIVAKRHAADEFECAAIARRLRKKRGQMNPDVPIKSVSRKVI